MVLVTLMAVEGDYTFTTRGEFFAKPEPPAKHAAPHTPE
jgi:hypothetical protein